MGNKENKQNKNSKKEEKREDQEKQQDKEQHRDERIEANGQVTLDERSARRWSGFRQAQARS